MSNGPEVHSRSTSKHHGDPCRPESGLEVRGMATTPTYPGVYIEEVPSQVRRIVGVSTSTTAFIGRALRGPVDKAEEIHSFPEYERRFGGLSEKSNMSYAVYHYFLNGGRDAVVVRVHNAGEDDEKTGKATFAIRGSTLKLEASNPGAWGSYLDIAINHDVDEEKEKEDETIFNLAVNDRKTGARETFVNLSTRGDRPKFTKRVLEEESDLVRIHGEVPTGTGKPPEGATTRENGGISLDPESVSDGFPLEDANVIGDPDARTGIYALDDVDLFNLLCIPPYKEGDETTPGPVYAKALRYCEKRRAILIVDPPEEWRNTDEATKGIESPEFGLERSPNAAVFFPRIKAPDPREDNRVRDFVPCGAVAGVIARIDAQRGVWKSPAGSEATLKGASDLTFRLTDEEAHSLSSLGINCLRTMPGRRIVVWGARTMQGADRLTEEWKYLPVRRTALYIEERLYRGTQWAVFEPNDEPLWSQIRLNVGAFMHGLFRQGAFQGSTPKEAYFVKCDKGTTTQDDIDRGIVNIMVGFAPLKPAEFVVLMIQQIAGQKAR